jgi:hypothetical protein
MAPTEWLIEAARRGPQRDLFTPPGQGIGGIGPTALAPDPTRPAPPPGPVSFCGTESRYGRVVLERVVEDISRAGDGQQEATFSAGAYKIARLISGGHLAPDAIEAVCQAAYAMRNFDSRRPWTRRQIDAKIDYSLERGRMSPWVHQDWISGLGR